MGSERARVSDRRRVIFTLIVVGTVDAEISEDELADVAFELADAVGREANTHLAASTVTTEWELAA